MPLRLQWQRCADTRQVRRCKRQRAAALSIFTVNDARCTSRAVDAGAIEALVVAMHGHVGSAGVQERACTALYFIIKGNDENKLRARNAGAKASAEAALKIHHATENVLTEAQDLLQQVQL